VQCLNRVLDLPIKHARLPLDADDQCRAVVAVVVELQVDKFGGQVSVHTARNAL